MGNAMTSGTLHGTGKKKKKKELLGWYSISRTKKYECSLLYFSLQLGTIILWASELCRVSDTDLRIICFPNDPSKFYHQVMSYSNLSS